MLHTFPVEGVESYDGQVMSALLLKGSNMT